MVLSTIITRRYVLNPLTNLAASISQISDAENTAVYGYERDDEIGVLSRTILQSQEKLKHREILLNTVNNVASMLLAVEDDEGLDSALTQSLEMIGMCLDADCVVLLSADSHIEGIKLTLISRWLSEIGLQNPRVELNTTLLRGVYKEFEEKLLSGGSINGPVTDLPIAEQRFLNPYDALKSIVIIPLMLDGQLWGFFSIDNCVEERALSEKELDIVRSAGLMFVSVFGRILQRELAITDELTGIRNRRYFAETADRELRSCLNDDRDFSLIMIDIDHFKKVNDRYGHDIGDEVLRIFAARLRNVLKFDTLLSRYGGEEFAVTLAGVNHENAMKTAWRLHSTIESTPFWIDEIDIRVTASFGVASKDSQNDKLPDLISNADKALYKAKDTGRNTVVSFDNIVA
jgi:diguanylate cyclase (GGDEF)-like protein